MSPTALAHLDELNCSSMSLVPSQPGIMSAHYFCTVPNSATTVALNTGHTYQTLQPRQTSTRQASIYTTDSLAGTCRVNGECFKRNLFLDRTLCTQNGHYTPLLKHATNTKLPPIRHLQASQPDLTENTPNEQPREGQTVPTKGTLVHCDRALSLSDLTPQALQLLPSPTEERLLKEQKARAPLSTDYIEPQTNEQFSARRSHKPSNVCCNRTIKSLAVGLDQAGALSGSYNSASFV
ncbi:unnamed protein product [Echinostoma caproni]|uniref:Uncharacterized protein n=1 Tax=Echinostoma caproni TaxID=27848 RepID=A0A183AQ80_9TREM|nr:unnamed protein product [Echinostoma caproni]